MIKGFNTCTEMKEQRKNAKTGMGETPNQIQVCFAESQPAWRIRVIMNARLCGARVCRPSWTRRRPATQRRRFAGSHSIAESHPGELMISNRSKKRQALAKERRAPCDEIDVNR